MTTRLVIRFVSLEQVLEIHEEQVGEHGGALGVRNQGGLESAVAAPEASYGGEYLHPTIFDMAAAYAFHIAENQPFLDGNKRTALATALLFLLANGIETVVDDADVALFNAMLAVATKVIGKPELADILRDLCGEAPGAP